MYTGRYAIILEAHGIPSSWGGRDTSIEGNFTINIFCQNQEITPIPTSYPTPPTAPTVPLPTPYIYKRACQATTGCCSGSNCYFNDGCLSGYGGVCGGGNSSSSWGERIEIENKYENIRDYGSDIHVEIDRKGCILFNGEIMENNKLYSETYDFDDCNTYDGYCGWECAVWLCTNSQICDQDGNVIVDGGGSIGLSKACRDIHSVELMILFLAFMIIFV